MSLESESVWDSNSVFEPELSALRDAWRGELAAAMELSRQLEGVAPGDPRYRELLLVSGRVQALRFALRVFRAEPDKEAYDLAVFSAPTTAADRAARFDR